MTEHRTEPAQKKTLGASETGDRPERGKETSCLAAGCGNPPSTTPAREPEEAGTIPRRESPVRRERFAVGDRVKMRVIDPAPAHGRIVGIRHPEPEYEVEWDDRPNNGTWWTAGTIEKSSRRAGEK